MGDNKVSVKKYLSQTLQKTIDTIGMDATIELLQQGQGLFDNIESKIITTTCRIFRVSPKSVLRGGIRSPQAKYANDVICFFLKEHAHYDLEKITTMFNPSISKPTAFRYARINNNLSSNIKEHINVMNKINKIRKILNLNNQ